MREQYADASRLDARVAIYERFSASRESWQEWLFARLALVPGERVLDAGAGSGRLWRECAGRLPERVGVLLADLSPVMLQEARARLAGCGGTGARLMVGHDPAFFDLDRAAEEIAAELGPPRVHRRRDVLRVTDAAPLLAYVRSLLPLGVRERELGELAAHVEREIASAGALSIGVAVGAVEVVR